MNKDTTVVLGAQGVVNNAASKRGPLSTGAEWTFELLAKYDRAIGAIAVDEFGLDCYRNQIEVISSEQMLDAYSMTGCPSATRTGASASRSSITITSTAPACAGLPTRS
jgi:hypothetical protein